MRTPGRSPSAHKPPSGPQDVAFQQSDRCSPAHFRVRLGGALAGPPVRFSYPCGAALRGEPVAGRIPRRRLSTGARPLEPSCILLQMTDSELPEFYRRYITCCSEHRIADLGEFVAPDVVINGTDAGLDAYADVLAVVIRAFPDYRWERCHLVIDAPWVAAHLTDTGTHRGTFLGVQATGRPVHVQEFAIYRIDTGRIAEVWGRPGNSVSPTPLA
jgi:predicted ester cyclase